MHPNERIITSPRGLRRVSEPLLQRAHLFEAFGNVAHDRSQPDQLMGSIPKGAALSFFVRFFARARRRQAAWRIRPALWTGPRAISFDLIDGGASVAGS